MRFKQVQRLIWTKKYFGVSQFPLWDLSAGIMVVVKTNIQFKMMNTVQYTCQLFASYRWDFYPESARFFEDNTNITEDFQRRPKSSEVQNKAMVSYLKFPTLWVTSKGLFQPNLHTMAEVETALTFPSPRLRAYITKRNLVTPSAFYLRKEVS